MNRAFHIAPGRYVIPNIGELDTNKEISDDKAFAIYQLPRRVFPWISLGEGAIDFLKKQKLRATEVAALIENAQTLEEAELLSSLSDTKTVLRALEQWKETSNQKE